MQLSKGYVRVREGELHYRRAVAGGGGTSVLLLQLTPRASEQYEPALQLLAARGYDCWAFDLMGYGRSDKRQRTWEIADYAASIDEAISALDLQPVYLVSGHFSTLVALELILGHRRAVKGLVLDGTPAWTPEDRAEKARSHGTPPYAEPASFSSDGSHMEEFWRFAWGFMSRQHPTFKVEPASDYALRRLVISLLESQFPPTAAQAMYDYDPIPRLRELDMPVLAVTSQTDSLRPCHERVLGLLRHGTGHEFAGVHPLYLINCPAEAKTYVDLLDGFFRC